MVKAAAALALLSLLAQDKNANPDLVYKKDIGVSLEDGAGALAGAGVSRWRMESFTNEVGVRVLNDAYNANPEMFLNSPSAAALGS